MLKEQLQKLTDNIIVSDEILNAFPRWETKQACPLLPLLINITLEILVNALGLEKEKKAHQLERKKSNCSSLQIV